MFFFSHSSLTIDPLSIDLCLFLILAQDTLKFKPTEIVSLDLCTLGSVKINLIFLKPLSELIFVYSFLSLLCHGHVVGRREKSLRFLLFSIILFLVLFHLWTFFIHCVFWFYTLKVSFLTIFQRCKAALLPAELNYESKLLWGGCEPDLWII